MADPYQEYQDLIWGRWNPLDDPSDQASQPGNAAPQDQSAASSFDPSQLQPANVGILGPLPPDASPSQDQSAATFDPSRLQPANGGILGRINPASGPGAQDRGAAFLDPSALQQSAKVGILGPVTPPGAVAVTSGNRTFDVPNGANFNNVYRAGQYIGTEPIPKQFDDIIGAEGQHGTFDFQRLNGPFNSDYRDASNYGVGVLMRGAGYSWPATAAAASLYATYHGRPDVIWHDWPWWGAGYDAAANGQLPKGEGR